MNRPLAALLARTRLEAASSAPLPGDLLFNGRPRVGEQAVGRPPLRRGVGLWLLLLGSLLAALLLAVLVGDVPLTVGDVLAVLGRALGLSNLHPSATASIIVLQLRLPEAVAAALVGGSLAVAGALLQGLFRNPLADPFVLGSSSGAALAAVVAVVLGWQTSALGFSAMPLAGFAGSVLTVLAVYLLARRRGSTPTVNLLLAGVAISSLLGALMNLLMISNITSMTQWRAVLSWLLGGISVDGWSQIVAVLPLIGVGGVAALALAGGLNVLSMGEERAATLGLRIVPFTALIVATSALLTGCAVAMGGLIGFVGLFVPHIMRLLLGAENRRVVATAMLAGSAFLCVADTLARRLLAPDQIPLGVLTALVGAPFFLALLRRNAHAGNGQVI